MNGATRTAAILTIFFLVVCRLPMLGVWLAGQPLEPYEELMVDHHLVAHEPFSWVAFLLLASVLAAVLAPFAIRGMTYRPARASPAGALNRSRFPAWGWVGLGFGIATWILAWTRFPWFAPLQQHTFAPLWLSYIVVVNALTYDERDAA